MSISLNSLYVFSIFLFTAASLALGIFSFLRDPHTKSVRFWFFMSVAIGVWGVSHLLALQAIFRGDVDKVIMYSKILHMGAAFIPVFFCHFVLEFLYQKNKYSYLLIIGYPLSLLFALISFTRLIIGGASPKTGFPLWLDAGNLYPLLVIFFYFYVFVSIYFLYLGYRRSDGIMKRKRFYILLAAIIGFGGASTNWLPQLVGIYPFGSFVAWLYPLLVTYGIFVDEIKIKVRF